MTLSNKENVIIEKNIFQDIGNRLAFFFFSYNHILKFSLPLNLMNVKIYHYLSASGFSLSMKKLNPCSDVVLQNCRLRNFHPFPALGIFSRTLCCRVFHFPSNGFHEGFFFLSKCLNQSILKNNSFVSRI